VAKQKRRKYMIAHGGLGKKQREQLPKQHAKHYDRFIEEVKR